MSKKRNDPVKDIDDFFEKEGFADIVQNFLTTEQFKQFASKAYIQLKESVEEMHADLPGHLTSEAVRLWKEAEYSEEIFENDIIVNMKMRLHFTIISFKEYLSGMISPEELKQAITKDNYAGLMRDAREISITLVKEVLQAHYSQIVPPQYISEELLEELMHLITNRRGGAIVFLNLSEEEDDSRITH